MADEVPDALERGSLRPALGRRAARGLVVTMGGQWGRLVLQTASTAVLARLLLPGDFGLVAMVVAVTGLAEQVKDLGLAAATVQRDKLEDRQVTGLFWVNAALGAVLAAVVAACAPLVAAFYGRPELTGLTLVLALGFVAGGLSVQHAALLQRRLRFGALATSETGAFAIGVVAAVTAAAAGAGYWSLAVLPLASAWARTVLLWAFCRWRPGRPRRDAGIRELLSFGGGVSTFNLLNYVSRNADNVLIGKVSGATSLGLYSRAYTLLLLPLQQLNGPLASVAVPVLSILRGEPAKYRAFYRSAVGGLALVGMPLVVLLVVCAPEVIAVLLGPGWDGAVPIFRALGLAGVVHVVGNTNGWIYVSWGSTGRMARWALVSRPLMVVSIAIGLPWGPLGVAVSYAVGQLVLAVPGFANAVRGTPLTLGDVGGAVWRPAALAAVTGGVAAALQALVDGPPLAVLAAVGVPAVLVHAGLTWAWRPTRESVRLVLAQRGRR
ncbi:lipopolysaccharide biosynthesis protein [Motilibacter deserti]|uniref:Lipopolysaccharide biosynthesis protein n=1 Tax=Motilibacter deserti TaxID=2714956 RepID=A0ABX0GV76_9ACTN|nr:lipopolysaccharide biosynthesis protein [Motilibacter deserti]NHC14408.1 lipopolysaccharide biosynthesis protein [Motilibacter deserti]